MLSSVVHNTVTHIQATTSRQDAHHATSLTYRKVKERSCHALSTANFSGYFSDPSSILLHPLLKSVSLAATPVTCWPPATHSTRVCCMWRSVASCRHPDFVSHSCVGNVVEEEGIGKTEIKKVSPSVSAAVYDEDEIERYTLRGWKRGGGG